MDEEGLKYKKALRLALGVLAIMVVMFGFTIISMRANPMYRAGYVNGWNDCRQAQIELMQNTPQEPVILPLPVQVNGSEQDARIQIVVE
jgi:hypothetical protein